ncbi:hypothetical protein FUT79_09030 [Treponema phagedenis]|uniref:hypothetical protein n=1 Tax=Treponema phagedenis TaxID=162 RepID=UPI0011E7EA11|nr:hypothetical protein [Treponema phagedenis]QEJ95332.1 hypothetical protein FUT79_09030 [Treponema phagedenis]
MRKALYAALKEIAEVYNTGRTQKIKGKPFLILSFDAEIKTRMGNWTTFSVFVFCEAGDLSSLDETCEKVIKALDKKVLHRVEDASSFVVNYTGCGTEYVEDEFSAVAKQLHFRIPSFGRDFM